MPARRVAALLGAVVLLAGVAGGWYFLRQRQPLKILWRYHSSADTLEFAAAADGVFVVEWGHRGFGQLAALDLRGRTRWRVQLAAAGLREPEVLPDGAVRLRSNSGQACVYDTQGNLRWEFVPRHWEAPGHPPLAGGPKAELATAAGRILYRITAEGQLAWARVLVGEQHSPFGGPVWNPAESQFVYNLGDSLLALNPEGSQCWHTELGDQRAMQLGADGAGNILAAGFGTVLALDSHGRRLTDIPFSAGFPALGAPGVDELLVVGESGSDRILALDAECRQVWSATLPGVVNGAPLRAGELVLVHCTIDGRISLLRDRLGLPTKDAVDQQDLLVALTPEGRILWQQALGPSSFRLFATDGANRRVYYSQGSRLLVAAELRGAQ
jgi:outer membrane protein assembly factor BamB